jgi:biopolymer transport protein ExbD
MRLNKHRPIGSVRFNMTPMIDIVFLLIIFFMTVSQITRATDLPLPLPRVTEGDEESKTATVTINLNQQGQIIVSNQRLTLDGLTTSLQKQLEAVAGAQDRIRIQIRCDRNCECRHVDRVLNRLTELGFQQVRAAVTDS